MVGREATEFLAEQKLIVYYIIIQSQGTDLNTTSHLYKPYADMPESHTKSPLLATCRSLGGLGRA